MAQLGGLNRSDVEVLTAVKTGRGRVDYLQVVRRQTGRSRASLRRNKKVTEKKHTHTVVKKCCVGAAYGRPNHLNTVYFYLRTLEK